MIDAEFRPESGSASALIAAVRGLVGLGGRLVVVINAEFLPDSGGLAALINPGWNGAAGQALINAE